jgi:hypothetical protein
MTACSSGASPAALESFRVTERILAVSDYVGPAGLIV